MSYDTIKTVSIAYKSELIRLNYYCYNNYMDKWKTFTQKNNSDITVIWVSDWFKWVDSLKISSLMLHMWENVVTVGSGVTGPPEFLPLYPIVNSPYNIQCYGNKMNQIVENLMLPQYLQLKLSVLLRTTFSVYLSIF